MNQKSETVVFFGSGPVAAHSLHFLAQHFVIEAVITKAAPEHHKGTVPVEKLAKQQGLTLMYANTQKELDALIWQKAFISRLGIIVDFGVIVSEVTIASFELGIVNSHFSLLPRWRGADPISFAILAGDKKTGVSLMLIEPSLDTGKLLVQKSLEISAEETTPTLTAKLINLSNRLLAEYLPLYLAGQLKVRAQPHPERATYSRKLTKEDGLVDWQKPAEQLEREVRAFADWPKSHTIIAGKEVIITKARVFEAAGEAGKVEVRGKLLIVHTGNKSLLIENLKPAGKPGMTAEAFLAGYKQYL